jgi:hypothetical protein
MANARIPGPIIGFNRLGKDQRPTRRTVLLGKLHDDASLLQGSVRKESLKSVHGGASDVLKYNFVQSQT